MARLAERVGLVASADPGRGDRALRARAGFYLFTSGGAIGLVSLALPAQAGRHGPAIAAAALAAIALGLVELAAFDRLPLAAFQVFTVCGTALVSAAIFFGGVDGALYGLFYFWVVLYAAYFFDARATALHVVGIGGAFGLVLALDGYPRGPLAWFLTMGTLAVVAALVVLLRGRLERLLAGERSQVERLVEVDRLKDDFIATVSHELRTPVAAVYGAAETLTRVDVDEERRRALIDVLRREARRLARLVSDILVSESLDRGTLRLETDACDVRALAEEVVAAARLAAGPSRTLTLESHADVPPGRADAERLRQVLTNVVDNALKYSPPDTPVTVALDAPGGRVRIRVRDEGIGIPPAERERVFEKFHRLDPQLTRGVTGSGLGLYIARRLAEAMGGRIWAEAGDPGAVIAIELEAARPSAGVASCGPSDARGRPERPQPRKSSHGGRSTTR